MNHQLHIDDIVTQPGFDGPAYESKYDHKRLTGQLQRVYNLMKDGRWRTLSEIADATKDPHASISAQLRHLRKERFGAHTVNRRARGERVNGLFEYSLVVNEVD
jgi:hypothetical protein